VVGLTLRTPVIVHEPRVGCRHHNPKFLKWNGIFGATLAWSLCMGSTFNTSITIQAISRSPPQTRSLPIAILIVALASFGDDARCLFGGQDVLTTKAKQGALPPSFVKLALEALAPAAEGPKRLS